MNDPSGPYSKKEVENLTVDDRRQLKKQAKAFALTSKELIKIIYADKALKEKVFKHIKIREAVKKKLRPTYRRLLAKKK